MNSNKLKAFIELLRPVNALIVFLTIAAAALLAGLPAASLAGMEFALWSRILLAALAGALIAGGGYAINDYYDVEIDKINRPARPLPRGALSPTEAWWTWRLFSSAGVLMSAFLGPYTLAIALGWVISLYFYSKRFKRSVLLGNLIVGLATGLAFIYGGFVAGNVERSVLPAVFAFLINVARELVKDVEDVKGDAHGEAGTLPVKHGLKPALVLATVTLLLLIGSTLAAYRWGAYNLQYLFLVALIDMSLIVVMISMWRNAAPANMRRLSTVLKIDMLLGLIAIYVGTPV